MPECFVSAPLLVGGVGYPCSDFVVKIVLCTIAGENVTFSEAMSTVRDCEDLFIHYSCPPLPIRKTREEIHQRWIPQSNLERCARLNVM